MAERGETLLPVNYSDFIVRDEDRKSLPWDRFNCWIKCFCVVTFDLELGQVIEVGMFCRPCTQRQEDTPRQIDFQAYQLITIFDLSRPTRPDYICFSKLKGLLWAKPAEHSKHASFPQQSIRY